MSSYVEEEYYSECAERVFCDAGQLGGDRVMAPQISYTLIPPFTREIAVQKVRKAEDSWNSRNPQQVALAYTSVVNGGIGKSLSRAEMRSCNFSHANGNGNWSID